MEDEFNEILVPITNELERRIADAFEVFDHSGNKTIDVREVGTVVRALGCCPTEAEIQEILLAVEDPEYPGSVRLAKFMPHIAQLITEHRYEPASPAKLLEAFQVLDQDGRGFVTKDYISTLMTEDGEPFSQDELDEMLEIAIDPQSQTVPYEYYINKLMYIPSTDNNIYKIADEVEASKPPPPPPPKRFSEFLQTMQQSVTQV